MHTYHHSSESPAKVAAQFINNTLCNVFLTGRAGTGKTTFLREIAANTHKNFAIVAPTGIAAINAGGMTIHSFFQVPPCAFLPTYDKSELRDGNFHNAHSLIRTQRLSTKKQKIIRDLELLIVDEVSMLRADLLDAIDTIMRSVRRAHNRPFGGAQVLFIGDLQQLPPVIKDEEWSVLSKFYKSAWFFHANVLQDNPPLYIELEKIYRQSDEKFIGLLNNLRNGKVTKADEEMLNRYYKPGYHSIPLDQYIQLTTHNHKAETLNNDALRRLPEKTMNCEAKIEDDFPASMYPTDPKLQLKIGAQVMFVRNDAAVGYYNGKIGRVIYLDTKEIHVQCEGEDAIIKAPKHTWENLKYIADPVTGKIDTEVAGTFTQFPVRLAWAITVHKSQGLTFSKAILDLEQAFAPGQVYVALSRLTSPEGLILSTRVNFSSLAQDKQVAGYSSSKEEISSLLSLLETEKQNYLQHYVMSCFDLKPLSQTFMRFIDEVPHDEERSIRAKHQPWARNIVNEFQPTEQMAAKFLVQIYRLGNDWTAILARVRAAKNYFRPVLASLHETINKHIAMVSAVKGAKQYREDVQELRIAVFRHLHKMEKAEKLLQSVISESAISREELYAAEFFPLYPRKEERSDYYSAEETEPPVKKKKKMKGDSVAASLVLHKEGKSVAAIAEARGLTIGTVMSHFIDCVADGRCEAIEFIDNTKVAEIRAASEQLGTLQVSAIKEHLGENYSFDELRMVLIRDQQKQKKEIQTAGYNTSV